MDKFGAQCVWHDHHYWIKDFPDIEFISKGIQGIRAYRDRKCLSNADNVFVVNGNGAAFEDFSETDESWEMLTLEEAFLSLQNSDELPSLENFICILRKCRKKRNYVYAKRVHMHILGHGMESHKILGNHLVPTLVECGCILDAIGVFHRLDHPNEHSWTSLIQGYNDSENFLSAMALLDKMQDNCIRPSRHTYVALLKACSRMNYLEYGKQLHTQIVKEHYEDDIFICNMLIDMYAKCGSFQEAEYIFDMLVTRDVVSWTTLIAGYVEHGLAKEALKFLDRMVSEKVILNDVTLICGLKACGRIGNLEKGQELHSIIIMDGYDQDSCIANALLDMYAKCGALIEAHFIFDVMSSKDEVSWNSLIVGYADHGYGEEALKCFEQMQQVGKRPNVVTLICTLKACGIMGALDWGKELHSHIDREGYGEDIVISNALLDMYCRCGSITDAWSVFDEMSTRDVISWTTIMQGLLEQGFVDEALQCMEQMPKEGIQPDSIAYILSLKCCGMIGTLDKGQEIHKQIDREGYNKELIVSNAVIDMYAKCGSLEAAWEVFQNLPTRTVVSWTALISGHVTQGRNVEALELYERMQLDGVLPNAVTFVSCLRACGAIKGIHKGQEIHSDVTKKGLERYAFVGNCLVDMYAKCESLEEAQGVLERLPNRDIISWTALIAGYVDGGLVEKAHDCFIQMHIEGIHSETISWNALIKGHAENEETEKIFELYANMMEQGVLPDSVTFMIILRTFTKVKDLKAVVKVHCQVYKRIDEEKCLSNTLLHAYCDFGSLLYAQQVFDNMRTRDHVAWTTLIAGYVQRKDYRHALHLFETMMRTGVQPDGVTFLTILKACKNGKLTNKAQQYYKMMEEFGIKPTEEHNSVIIELLGNAGRIDEAVAIILQ